jgi:hypothetical protein
MVSLVYRDTRLVKSGTERHKGQGQDLVLLLRYLSLSRHQRYRLESRTAPTRDQVNLFFRETRRERRPLAVEWRLLTKEDLVRAACRLRSKGVPVRFGWHKMSLSAFALLVEDALAAKLSKDSLDDRPSAERVLILRSRVEGIDETAYLWSPLKLSRVEAIDHLFIVCRGNLLQCW